ncbi:uncharacterized protein LOC108920120 isoform X4 [Scleropages formosus]|uniref:uncharacterized protein LOC108920120 isoform X4 n=1 Tax=Scleropages formosus TaxID=113540 RepID=UPI00087900AB|nr:uncharacterized protein LOC108920120 isoform X4 [Scleropages formosus]
MRSELSSADQLSARQSGNSHGCELGHRRRHQCSVCQAGRPTGAERARLGQPHQHSTAVRRVRRRGGDLTDEEMVKMLVEQTISRYGRLDVLVNSAGILTMGSIETTDLAQYDKVMNINVRSVYHLTQLCVPHLIQTKGSIVNVSSVNGQRSFPGVLAYCMSKSAIDQFTRCTALELASKQVRVNSVCPGVIITEVHRRAGLDEEQYAKFLERCKETHALGRPGKVEEVASAIAFLASDAASFITGINMPIDGGRHAMCPR